MKTIITRGTKTVRRTICACCGCEFEYEACDVQKERINQLERENAELKQRDIRCASSVAEMITSCDKCGLLECYGCEHSYTAVQEVKKIKHFNRVYSLALAIAFTGEERAYYIKQAEKALAEERK